MTGYSEVMNAELRIVVRASETSIELAPWPRTTGCP